MERAVQRALDAGLIQNRATNFKNYDYYVVCISTHRSDDMFMPNLDGLFDIAKKLSKEAPTGALVGIDSTITRGTSRKLVELLSHRLHVAHVPHRFYINDMEEHGVKQLRVAGGCESCCLNEAIHFYKDVLGIPLHIVSSIEIAELCKVVENSHRFMEIAFAEELKMVCDNTGIDFEELRKAINTKWNTKILEARDGIGGHCLPKDSQMFIDFSKNVVPHSILESAKMIDYKYRASINRAVSNSTVLEQEDQKLAVHLSAEIVSLLKEEFNITEAEIQSFLTAMINRMIKEHPEAIKS